MRSSLSELTAREEKKILRLAEERVDGTLDQVSQAAQAEDRKLTEAHGNDASASACAKLREGVTDLPLGEAVEQDAVDVADDDLSPSVPARSTLG
jgi:hypothetical protein